MTLQEIKNLANSPKYTQEVKAVIKSEAEKYGITIPNCKCRNKWHDVVMQIYNIERKKQSSPVVRALPKTDAPNSFRYKCTSPSMVNGKVYDNNTPVEEINALKRRNPRLFETFYTERHIPTYDDKKEVNFYPQDAEGTTRKEVNDEDN